MELRIYAITVFSMQIQCFIYQFISAKCNEEIGQQMSTFCLKFSRGNSVLTIQIQEAHLGICQGCHVHVFCLCVILRSSWVLCPPMVLTFFLKGSFTLYIDGPFSTIFFGKVHRGSLFSALMYGLKKRQCHQVCIGVFV